MASNRLFTILCIFQMVIGFLTFVFGMIDRIGIQMQISFLMLPIWNGVLIGCAGLAGLVISRQRRKQGYDGSGTVSGVKAVSMLCFGLSLLTIEMYGHIVMYSGFRIALDRDAARFPTAASRVRYSKLDNTFDGTTDDDTRQSIFAMIIIFSLVEMFLGAWIVMLDKEKMVIGSSSSDQPVYVVATGGNVPMPARAAVPPINQQQQQQNFVMLQPSAVNQPQVIQPPHQYVMMQNQVPVARVVNQGVRTDSPDPQSGDIRLTNKSNGPM